MSLFELLIVLIVAFIVVKPEDLPKIAKNIRKFNNFFYNTKRDIITYFDPESIKNDVLAEDNVNQINLYLKKIASLGGEYEGEYSLTKVKSHYQKLVSSSLDIERNNRQLDED